MSVFEFKQLMYLTQPICFQMFLKMSFLHKKITQTVHKVLVQFYSTLRSKAKIYLYSFIFILFFTL